MLSKKGNRFLAVLLSGVAAWPPSGRAMDQGIEEMLFTDIPVQVEVASLFKESNIQAGSTVELIEQKDWLSRGDRTVMEAISRYPSMYPFESATGVNLAIRGYAVDTAERGVGLLLDGIPLNTFTFQSGVVNNRDFALGLLDRIELIRGPGSSLYGSDSFHGVLSLRTADPTDDMVSARASAGGQSLRSGSGLVSRSMGSLRFTGGVSARDMDSQIMRYKSGNQSLRVAQGDTAHSAFAKLKTDPAKAATFDMAYYRNASHTELGLATNQFQSITSAGTFRGQDFATLTDVGKVGASLKLPAQMKAELTGYYWESTYEKRDRTESNVAIAPPTFSAATPNRFLVTEYVRDTRKGGRLLLKQPKEGNFLNTQWAAAYEFSQNAVPKAHRYRNLRHNGAEYDFPGSIFPPGPSDQSLFFCGFGPVPFALPQGFRDAGGQNFAFMDACRPSPERKIHSGFVQAKTSLPRDVLHLVYGTRYDNYSDFGHQWTPRAGLIFQPAPDAALKFLYGRAFRAPSAVEIYGQSQSFSLPSSRIKPETIDSYEVVAMKESFHTKNELVGYYTRWEDAIIWGGIGSPYENQGVNHAKGLEAKSKLTFKPWIVDLNGSYVVEARNDSAHYAMTFFPRWMANLGITRDMPEAQARISLNQRFFARYSIHMNTPPGGLGGNPEGTRRGKGYHRMDLTVAKGLGRRMGVTVDLRNILNRRNYAPTDVGGTSTFTREEPKFHGWLTLNYHMGDNGGTPVY